MIIGIGTDFFRCDRIATESITENDPFYMRAYTSKERAQALGRPARLEYLASRFCAKEAVYKALSICGEEFKPGDIEIVDDEDGRPMVKLSGRTKNALDRVLGVPYDILTSISYDDGYVSSFAILQTSERG